jgi:hypothetical protein
MNDRPPPRPTTPNNPRPNLLFSYELTERDYRPEPLDLGIAADIEPEGHDA